MYRLGVALTALFAAAGPALAQPAQVLIIRHAEKPEEGNQLSLPGHERAAALVPYFQGTAAVLKFGPPAAIYAQAMKHGTSSARPIETVQPLADALHLTLNTSFERDDFKSMVHEIMGNTAYAGRSVLICWEHKVIPSMAAEFGATTAPTQWDGARFDRVWTITFTPNAPPAFQNLPQRLMFSDADH